VTDSDANRLVVPVSAPPARRRAVEAPQALISPPVSNGICCGSNAAVVAIRDETEAVGSTR
jgi:hypothetical protein